MARIIGGIGSSHVPTIGVAYDKGKQETAAWAPLFDGYKAAYDWLADKKPDVLIVFYNDHLNAFFYDLYPSFAMGVAPSYEVADEGAGKRPLPPLPGNPALAKHLAEQLINDEFDLSVFQDRPLDHGVFSPLPLLWPHKEGWPARSSRSRSMSSNTRCRRRCAASSWAKRCAGPSRRIRRT